MQEISSLKAVTSLTEDDLQICINQLKALESSPHQSSATKQYYRNATLSLTKGDIAAFNECIHSLPSPHLGFEHNILRAYVNIKSGFFHLSAGLFEDVIPSGKETADEVEIIYISLIKTGDFFSACKLFSRLAEKRSLSDGEKLKFAHTIKEHGIIASEQSVINLVNRLLVESHGSVFLLSDFISDHLTYKHNLEEEDFDIEGLIYNPIFINSLDKTTLTTVNIENAIKKVRELITISVLNQKSASAQIVQTMYKIAYQEYLKEHFTPLTDNEKKVISSLKQSIETALADNNPDGYTLQLLIYLMYSPAETLENIELIKRGQLPDFLNKLLLISYDVPKSEISIAKNTPALTSIDDQASKIVRQQYEENPYPRWSHVTSQEFSSLGHFLTVMFKQVKLKDRAFNPNSNILNAGCGTGTQPIQTAMGLKKSNIIAIDLSQRSLAYAQIKANELNVSNISFYQADILKIDQLNEKFDAIFSTGVLHHMDSPREGILKLKSVLHDDGVMLLALYSRRARQQIQELRDEIQSLKVPPTTENLMIYKQKVIEEYPALLSLKDIYSKSMFRDLLFHTHEKTYDWLEVQQLMSSCGLEIIAIKTPDGFQSDPDNPVPSVEALDQFEQQKPNAFIEMMTFVVQKQA